MGIATAAFFASKSITPIYEARAKILVQGGQAPGIPSVGDIQASEQLAQSYSDLIKTRPILEQVIESLSLPYGPSTLSGKISVRSPRSLIEIKAKDPDPGQASQIANTIARTFIEDFRDRQFNQIALFQAALGQYGITDDPTLIAAQAATLSTLSSPNTRLNVILAAALGLLVGGLFVIIIEYLDDRITTADELEQMTGLKSMGSVTGGISSLGSVLRQSVKSGSFPIILTDEHEHSALAESYKYVALNLEFSGLGTGETRALVITSGLPGEGKTTTASNLAVSLARGGKSVVLVDTDLRKPALHSVFGLDNSKGVTSVIIDNSSLDDVLSPTSVDNLRVITSGPMPPEPSVLLRSPRMRALMDSVADMADLVIYDSPPVLVVTDPIVMAAQVDSIILVLDAQRARRESVKRAAQLLQQANTPIVGAVVNKVPARGRGY